MIGLSFMSIPSYNSSMAGELEDTVKSTFGSYVILHIWCYRKELLLRCYETKMTPKGGEFPEEFLFVLIGQKGNGDGTVQFLLGSFSKTVPYSHLITSTEGCYRLGHWTTSFPATTVMCVKV